MNISNLLAICLLVSVQGAAINGVDRIPESLVIDDESQYEEFLIFINKAVRNNFQGSEAAPITAARESEPVYYIVDQNSEFLGPFSGDSPQVSLQRSRNGNNQISQLPNALQSNRNGSNQISQLPASLQRSGNGSNQISQLPASLQRSGNGNNQIFIYELPEGYCEDSPFAY